MAQTEEISIEVPSSRPSDASASSSENRASANFQRSSPVAYIADNYAIKIAIIDSHQFTRECMTEVLGELFDKLKITLFVDHDDFAKGDDDFEIILYHTHQNTRLSRDDHVFTVIDALRTAGPVIILSPVDCPDLMVSAFERGARAFIPTATTTPKQVVEIIRLVRAGGTFVPPSSLSLQKPGRSGLAPPALTVHEFTHRELAVLECLTLGKANKKIAFELKMSESTVKVHIKSIMTKLKCTNRTEVVCRAFDLGRIGALATERAV